MDEPDQYRAARAAKAQRLRELGVDPFGVSFTPTHTISDARTLAADLVMGDDGKPASTQPRSLPVRIAGRIGNLRSSSGKLLFATLYDRSRADVYRAQYLARLPDIDGAEAKKARGIQLFLETTALGAVAWEQVGALDLADWIGVEGTVGRTRRGEVSLFVTQLTVLGKALLPPPHQAGADSGVLSAETRSRQRYLDLMMSDASLSTFVSRSRIISTLRRFFSDRGYLEVETPILQPIPGGATARPFVTHHNALDIDLYLRIAPELYLKRLLVGGMERVFEVGRNFRNEGISLRHNPEFTMVEWYQAYADHTTMMALSEELFRHLADQVLGTRILRFASFEIDLDAPWRRLTYHQALRELGGLEYDDRDAVTAKARELGLEVSAHASYERLANAVWEAVVEPHLIQPTFITEQPIWLTPLCRTLRSDPSRSMRFELFMARMELGNAYTELNDPELQRSRFHSQAAEAHAAADQESGTLEGVIDEDYCTALDHGLPACGGQGLGIDRLLMLFMGQTSIRDVILFPTTRPLAHAGGSDVGASLTSVPPAPAP